MTKDPVCGMQIDEKQAAGKSDYKGQTYYFCSPGCKQKFEQKPDQYAKKTAQLIQRGCTL
ncbi:MAG: YHS domain-containing protein [Candidatus Angelobacter sp.]